MTKCQHCDADILSTSPSEDLALADYRDKAYERLHTLCGTRNDAPNWADIACILRERDELYEKLRASTSQPNRMGTTPSAEDVARTICLSYGRTPDDMTSIGEMCDGDNRPVPIWMVYEEQADAIIAAYELTSTPRPNITDTIPPVDWRMAVEAIKRRLNISSDHDFRKWSEIERVVQSVVACATLSRSRMGTTPTGIQAADTVFEYLKLRGIGDEGDAANIIHLLHKSGVEFPPATQSRSLMGTTPEMQKMYDEFGGLSDKLDARLSRDRNGQIDTSLGMKVGPGLCEEISAAVAALRALAATPAVGGGALEPVDNTIVNCARFVKWVLQEGPWQGIDLDGGGVQDKAESLGLIVSVPYDPEKHGAYNDCGCDAGDRWFEFSPGLNAASLLKKRDRAALAAQPASPLRGRDGDWIVSEEEIVRLVKDHFSTSQQKHFLVSVGLNDEKPNAAIRNFADAILTISASPPEQPAADQEDEPGYGGRYGLQRRPKETK